MAPTEGESIWVLIGRTDHPAILVLATPDAEGNVLVKWTSNGTTELVPLDSIKKEIAPRKRRKPCRLSDEKVLIGNGGESGGASSSVVSDDDVKKSTTVRARVSTRCGRKGTQKYATLSNNINGADCGRERTLPAWKCTTNGAFCDNVISAGRGRGRTLPAWMTQECSNTNDLKQNPSSRRKKDENDGYGDDELNSGGGSKYETGIGDQQGSANTINENAVYINNNDRDKEDNDGGSSNKGGWGSTISDNTASGWGGGKSNQSQWGVDNDNMGGNALDESISNRSNWNDKAGFSGSGSGNSSGWGSKDETGIGDQQGSTNTINENAVYINNNDRDKEDNDGGSSNKGGWGSTISDNTASGWGGGKSNQSQWGVDNDNMGGNALDESISNRSNWNDKAGFSGSGNSSGWGSKDETGIGGDSAEWNQNCLNVTFHAREKPTHRRQKAHQMVRSHHRVPVYRETTDEYYLKFRFPGRLIIIEENVKKENNIPVYRRIGGNSCELIGTKLEDTKGNARFKSMYGGKYIKLYYFITYGSGLKPRKAQRELEKIADFKALPPEKVISRIELLMSTAVWTYNKGAPYTFLLGVSDFEEIPENHHVGCGFIPPQMLKYLLGGITEIDVVQVRIVGESVGIFKGLLVKKNNIDRIQLPSSMKKVNKSRINSCSEVYIIFSQLYPSKPCKMIGKSLNPNLNNPPESAHEYLKKSWPMMQQYLLGVGVPENLLYPYANEAEIDYANHQHAYCIGVCDSTGCLPEGTIFLSGVGVGGPSREIFISRNPCTEIYDGKIIRIITEQPANMLDEDWELLVTMQFGVVVFASPADINAENMPEQIAQGDLDGDWYFVCWNLEILVSIDRNLLIQSRPIDDEIGSTRLIYKDKEDPLISSIFQWKLQEAVIYARYPDGKYLVKIGMESEVLTKDEILHDRQVVDKIISHNGAGKKCEVKILWGNGKITDELLCEKREEIPEILAEYALENKLASNRDWAWCKKFLREAEPVKIEDHIGCDPLIEFEVLFDDGSKRWKGHQELDRDLLVAYAKEQGLLDEVEWQWLKSDMEVADKDWFKKVQNQMSDGNLLYNHNEMVKVLHKAHKNIGDIQNTDSRYFGNAYKQATDLHKHSGRVRLPIHLVRFIPKDLSKFVEVLPDQSLESNTADDNIIV